MGFYRVSANFCVFIPFDKNEINLAAHGRRFYFNLNYEIQSFWRDYSTVLLKIITETCIKSEKFV
jgi:hypothetical protein